MASETKIESLLKDQGQIESVLAEYKRFLKSSPPLAPSTINAAFTAIDHFLRFLGLRAFSVAREDFQQKRPRALSQQEQKSFLDAVHTRPRAIDRAVPLLLLNTGIGVSECAALNLADISVAGRKSQIVIGSGKSDCDRVVPLNKQARQAVKAWLMERSARFEQSEVDEALFLNPQGRRMTVASIDRIVRKAGEICGINLSSKILRHTCLINLAQKGNDLIVVAAIGGHKRLETTRRYTAATKIDMRRALQSLLTEK